MSSEPLIRRSGPPDAPFLVRLADATQVAGWSPSALADALGRPVSRAWAAEAEGRVVGFVLAWLLEDELEVLLVAVETSHRRLGIATRLLAALEAGAAEEGATRAVLDVRETNAPARAFYTARGYRVAGLRPRYYRDGGTALVLDKSLRPPDVR